MTELERLPAVVKRTTISRSHLYALLKAGKLAGVSAMIHHLPSRASDPKFGGRQNG